MLKEDVIKKKEFHEKMKSIGDNISLIEKAIDDPILMSSIE